MFFFFFFGFFNSAICPFVIRNNLNLVFFLKGKMYQFPEKEPSLIYFLYTDSTFQSFSHFTSKSRIIPYKQLKIFSSKPKKGIIFLFFLLMKKLWIFSSILSRYNLPFGLAEFITYRPELFIIKYSSVFRLLSSTWTVRFII